MKRLAFWGISMLMLLSLCSCGSFTAKASYYDFRNSDWGDSKEAVKEVETEGTFALVNSSGMVYTDVTIFSKDAYLFYYFDDEGKFYRGAYSFQEKHSDPSDYIADYNEIKKTITRLYGEPAVDEIKAIDSSASSVSEEEALKNGWSKYYTMWETDQSKILLLMHASDSEIKLMLSYDNPNQ